MNDREYQLTGILWFIGWVFISIFISNIKILKMGKYFTPPAFLKKVFTLFSYMLYLLENKVLMEVQARGGNMAEYLLTLFIATMAFCCFVVAVEYVNLDTNKGIKI